jgi:DNA replication protein DnaC
MLNNLLETRDQRIERMQRDNPGRPIELCIAVVDEMWDKKRANILKRIPERFRDADIQDLGYIADGLIPSLEHILNNRDKDDNVGLILSGPTGSGKTHAVYAVLKWLAERNPEVISFISDYPQVIQSLRTEFSTGTYDELGSIWDKLNNNSGMSGGLIILDDVSSAKPTDFELDKMMAIISRRVDEYMPFIITTNIKTDDFINIFGERLASRLLGYSEIIEFKTIDRRIKEKKDE